MRFRAYHLVPCIFTGVVFILAIYSTIFWITLSLAMKLPKELE